ncbi:NACHT domain-containing protein [Streptomyces sp. NPDC059009]|uniref:NACHT domain-containing protein n=1 Tax=Streptomyces sp. NPDC059009 TaxID=3346694 RepID=UPI0036BDFFC7
MYPLLFMLGAAGALAVAWSFDLSVAETAVTVLLGLAPGFLAWEAFRVAVPPVDLDVVAKKLAVAVKNQWEDEAKVRRVNDPYPLPVTWRPADDDLAEPWPLLTDLARGWPGGPPGDPDRWPQDAVGLAGQDGQIGEVFTDRVPTRRLVILGEPGAGKSVLLIRLLQDLIERRTDGDLVPVLFSLASWNPSQPLKTWLAEQLRRAHPGLRAPAPPPVTTTATNSPGDLAQALLDAGRILLLLDGFDELPPALHLEALDALNRALPAKQPLVLASRTAPYRAALTRPDATVRLNGAAAIQLLPLVPETVAAYLRRDAGGLHAPAARRWDAVIARLGTDTPVGQALTTPLALFLARSIYTPRPHATPESAAAPHPDHLCDTSAFPDRTAVDTQLFDAFVPAAYAPDHPRPLRWKAEQAHRTLVFLARFLQTHRDGSPDLVWWEIHHALPTYTYNVGAGLALGLAPVLMSGLTAVSGLMGMLGLASGLLLAGQGRAPITRLRWSPRKFFVAGLAFGLMGLWGGLVRELERGGGLEPAVLLTVGLTVGLVAGLAVGLQTERPDLATTTAPGTLLSSDRRAFVLALGLVLAIMLAVGLAVVLTPGVRLTLGRFGIGHGIALVGGLGIGLSYTAWGHFVVARAYLAARGKVPWALMEFLQDAHERGVLRQVGAVYQFRHIDLQRHLAQQRP